MDENGKVNLAVDLDTRAVDALMEKLERLKKLLGEVNSLLGQFPPNYTVDIGVSVNGTNVE